MGLSGMDDGQSMLKIGLTLREEDEDNASKLVKSQRKDTGVKKLLLLSVFPAVPEVYTNIKLMLEDLGIEILEFTRTVDLKMALQLIGKPLGKPKYNCPFCDGCALFEDPYNLYRLRDIYAYHQVYYITYIFSL